MNQESTADRLRTGSHPADAPIRVAIVVDNDETRRMLERLIVRGAGMRCVCSCGSGKTALELLPQPLPDVAVIDLRLADVSGIECTARLKRALPELQVLILTAYGDNEQLFRALAAGASGYLLQRSSPAEIFQAIREVHQGGAPMVGEVARKVAQALRADRAMASGEAQRLTAGEEALLGLLAQGYTTGEIANQLAISFEAVRSHLRQVYAKLHVHPAPKR